VAERAVPHDADAVGEVLAHPTAWTICVQLRLAMFTDKKVQMT
jgi:hypothetical protein